MTQYVAITWPGPDPAPGVRLTEPLAVGPFETQLAAECYIGIQPPLTGSWRWRIVEIQQPFVAVAA